MVTLPLAYHKWWRCLSLVLVLTAADQCRISGGSNQWVKWPTQSRSGLSVWRDSLGVSEKNIMGSICSPFLFIYNDLFTPTLQEISFSICCLTRCGLVKPYETMVQVMACCLMAPSHYLNQCWLIITETLSLSSHMRIILQSILPKYMYN